MENHAHRHGYLDGVVGVLSLTAGLSPSVSWWTHPASVSSEIQTVRLPRCRSPVSYSGQFVVLYEPLTYLAWLRLKAVISNSKVQE
jgi:hypothetical protein